MTKTISQSTNFLMTCGLERRYTDAAKAGLAIMDKLDSDIYRYHNRPHAIDVMQDVITLSEMEHMSRCTKGLLIVAAAFHDTGFTEVYDNNEPNGVRIMAETIKQLGFSEWEIGKIGMMIMRGTAWPQQPVNKPEQILADADVANFGKIGERGFFALRKAVRDEMTAVKHLDIPEGEWLANQYRFLSKHMFFTSSAKKLYGEQAALNMEKLKAMAAGSFITPAFPIMGKCVYAGSFDPPTKGHASMIAVGAETFEKFVVAVGVNPGKKYMFTIAERVDMLKEMVKGHENVTVDSYENKFLVKYAESTGARYVLRGLRNADDFEFERGMLQANQKINDKIITFFLMPPPELANISSSLVKGLIGPEGWEEAVRQYVPRNVYRELLRKAEQSQKS